MLLTHVTTQVFHAEQVKQNNRSYHKRCATCNNCQKPLSSVDLCTGKDNEIYCKSCYARKFGAPGYRGRYISVNYPLCFF